MFKDNGFKTFEQRVWLATPTMHGEELKYMIEAYETNVYIIYDSLKKDSF